MILSHYCSRIPYLVQGIRKGNKYYGLEICTRTLPCFNELYDYFYNHKTKIIPDNIYELLTPVALAHWIMGDGAKLNKSIVLCTDSFSLREVIILMNVLKLDMK